MGRPQQAVIEQVRKLSAELPPAMVETLAEALRRAGSGWQAAKDSILVCLSQPHYRNLAADLFRVWESEAPAVGPEAVALALATASETERLHHEEQSIELVWTGPDTGVIPLRQTEQALLQIINASCERLLLVSYAVYQIPHVCEALLRAADRGVAIRIVVEASDRQGGSGIRAKLHALGESVARKATVYHWPADRRPRDGQGGQGVLHVKCAVADGRWLFLSSANLTENAFALNMELGVLVRGGGLPGLVEQQIGRLIETGVLVSPMGGSSGRCQ